MLCTTEIYFGNRFLQRLKHRSRGEWLDRPYAGNTTATGTFYGFASDGSITQAASTSFKVTGATSLFALGAITLAIAPYSFGGAVNSVGSNIDLAGTGGLIVGTTTANGTLTLASAGPITQAAATTVDATGASSLTATGASGSITLAIAGNIFGGAVTSSGSNIDLLQSSSGLILANTMVSGTFTADSLAGAITQAASTAVKVTGTSSLTAAMDSPARAPSITASRWRMLRTVSRAR